MALTHDENKKTVAFAIQTILNALNGGNQVELAQAVVETVSREHRTLQESFWSTMLLAQIQYAEAPSDLRNDAAVRLAKLVKAVAVKNNMDMGLPRI